MNILYVCSFALKYYTMVTVKLQINKIETPSFWVKVANVNASDIGTQIDLYKTFYWLNDGKSHSF